MFSACSRVLASLSCAHAGICFNSEALNISAPSVSLLYPFKALRSSVPEKFMGVKSSLRAKFLNVVNSDTKMSCV